MSPLDTNIHMLELVAKKLGVELCKEMTFVGGCTTGLLITDPFSRDQVRHTDDVDLIVSVISYVSFYDLKDRLKELGFKEQGLTEDEDTPTCAMFLDGLRVDFMPDSEEILGYSNRWFYAATKNAIVHSLPSGRKIKLVTPVYFLATKLEAFKGRGNGDVLGSRDIEDFLNVIDGRDEIIVEIQLASSEVKSYISSEVQALLETRQIDYAVQSTAQNNSDRINLLNERLESIVKMGR